MKKSILTLCFAFGYATNVLFGQSPTLSTPSEYQIFTTSGASILPLPMPYGSQSAFWSLRLDPQSPIYTDPNNSQIQRNVYDGRPADCVHNTGYDADGNLAFFIVDEYVFDKEGYLLDVMQQPGKRGYGQNDLLIIPHPTNCNQYYIVTTANEEVTFGDFDNGRKMPKYALLDLSLNRQNKLENQDRIGGIIEQNGSTLRNLLPNFGAPLIPADRETDDINQPKYEGFRYAVSPLNTVTMERYLYMTTGRYVHKFIVDASGIHFFTDPNHTTYFPFVGGTEVAFADLYDNNQLTNPGTLVKRTELELIPYNGGFRLASESNGAVLGATNFYRQVVVIDLDINGNVIPNTKKVITLNSTASGLSNYFGVRGLEFSPNGEIIYATTSSYSSDPTAIYYADLSVATPVFTNFMVNNALSYRCGFIELGFDGNMYFAGPNKLGVLSDPNNPQIGNFTDNAIPLNSYVASYEGVDPASDPATFYAFCYQLPDQIDGEDAYARFTDVCCKPVTGGATKYTVSAGVHSWSPGNNPFGNAMGDVYIAQELEVLPGAVLTISGMTFRFDELAYMNIQRGARVFLQNNTVLTSYECEGKMWQGVRVWGTTATAQNSITAHGRLNMNNSEINNAHIGVALNSTSFFGNLYTNLVGGTTGGIVQASNSQFINNSIDVQSLNYSQTSQSSFSNCVFETNAVLNDGSNPNTHIILTSVRGINIIGCDFQNVAPAGTFAVDQRGVGISSQNSDFKVTFRCNTINPIGTACNNKDKSRFDNLYRGIYANAIGIRTFTTEFAEFNNTTFGIYMGTIRNARITDNQFFNIGPYFNQAPYNNSAYGVYTNQSTGYIIENNYFTTTYTNTLGTTFGTIIVNSNNNGTSNALNKIYNNTYEDLRIGINPYLENVGFENNGLVNLTSGLFIQCNTFINNTTADITWGQGGIKSNQGSATSAANNIFSQNNNQPVGHLWNFNNQLVPNTTDQKYATYYHYNPSTTFKTEPISINSINTFKTINTGTFNPATHCPVKNFEIVKGNFSILKTANELEAQAGEEKLFLENKNIAANSLIAQKNANQISNGNFKNAMESLSPYLNDNVLIEVVNINIPHGIKKNILDANAPFNAPVITAIQNASLPNGIKNQLLAKAKQNGQLNAIDVKNATISNLLGEAQYQRDFVIHRYLTDSTILNGRDSAIILLSSIGGYDKTLDILDLLIEKGAYTEAQSLIANLRISAPHNEDLYRIAELTIAFNQAISECYIIKTDIAIRNEVEAIANKEFNERACIKASGFLQAILNYQYYEPIPDFTGLKIGVLQPNTSEVALELNDVRLSIYPNPSADFINLFVENVSLENTTITVFDQMGKVVNQVISRTEIPYIDVTKLPNGLYFVSIITVDGDHYVKPFIKN